MHDFDLDAWVAQAPNEQERQFREAVHCTLEAIGSTANLRTQMIMKGGVLMAIRYDTGRNTRDIDFSTTEHYRDFKSSRQDFITRINEALQSAAVDLLGYEIDLVVQSEKLKPREDGNFQTLHLKIGFAKRGSKQHKRLYTNGSTSFVEVDYSFNEHIHDMDFVQLNEGAKLTVYGQLTQIAEKYRALLQLSERSRERGQDVYDLNHLLTRFRPDEESHELLLGFIVEKCASRELSITRSSLRNADLIARAQSGYIQIAHQVEGEVPEFHAAFEQVASFYEALPWLEKSL
jgi:predicted nucleotidyltransferase component of viral defense system